MEVIIECGQNDKILKELGQVLYEIPLINSYVLRIEEQHLQRFKELKHITYYQITEITAQMQKERSMLNAEEAYMQGLSGKGITIAFLDTGIEQVKDLQRIVAFKDIINNKKKAYDDNGHGTHVAGIACGSGLSSNGKYMGIAKDVNIVSVKILDENGAGNSAHVLAGLQWIMDNKAKLGIRIINMSVGTVGGDIRDPLVKAVEALWDDGTVVIAAAGNNGPSSGTITSPGISKKIITVGAAGDDEKLKIWGNNLINFSGRGPTKECVIKPDVIAPGANVISCLASNVRNENIVDNYYLKLSGTSMATPMVSGAIALLLQKYPKLSPNNIKYLLKQSCISLGFPANQQGWGILNIGELVKVCPL